MKQDRLPEAGDPPMKQDRPLWRPTMYRDCRPYRHKGGIGQPCYGCLGCADCIDGDKDLSMATAWQHGTPGYGAPVSNDDRLEASVEGPETARIAAQREANRSLREARRARWTEPPDSRSVAAAAAAAERVRNRRDNPPPPPPQLLKNQSTKHDEDDRDRIERLKESSLRDMRPRWRIAGMEDCRPYGVIGDAGMGSCRRCSGRTGACCKQCGSYDPSPHKDANPLHYDSKRYEDGYDAEPYDHKPHDDKPSDDKPCDHEAYDHEAYGGSPYDRGPYDDEQYDDDTIASRRQLERFPATRRPVTTSPTPRRMPTRATSADRRRPPIYREGRRVPELSTATEHCNSYIYGGSSSYYYGGAGAQQRPPAPMWSPQLVVLAPVMAPVAMASSAYSQLPAQCGYTQPMSYSRVPFGGPLPAWA